MSGSGAYEALDRLAANLPREPKTWDEGRGPRDHYAEMWLTFDRDDAGEWAWEMEHLALDPPHNIIARHPSLAEVLRIVTERLAGASAPPCPWCDSKHDTDCPSGPLASAPTEEQR